MITTNYSCRICAACRSSHVVSQSPPLTAPSSRFLLPGRPARLLAELLPDCAILLVLRDSEHENPPWSRDAFQVMNPAILIDKT